MTNESLENTQSSKGELAKIHVFQAIGEFMVAFSQLHHALHMNICSALSQGGPSDAFRIAFTALGERGTQDTLNSFFALCHETKQSIWKREDFEILSSLRGEIQLIIEERNRLAHDLWTVGYPYQDPPEGFQAVRVRNHSSPKRGYIFSSKPFQVEDLHRKVEAIRRIIPIISFIGAGVACREPDLLSDHLMAGSSGVTFKMRSPPGPPA